MKKSLTNQLLLKLCLYTIRMDEYISLYDHLMRFTLILNDLAKLSIKVKDDDQAPLVVVLFSHII
jgi:gag-polypeptide of LTR copia-type